MHFPFFPRVSGEKGLLWPAYWRRCWRTVPLHIKGTSVKLPRLVPLWLICQLNASCGIYTVAGVEAGFTLSPSLWITILSFFVPKLLLFPLSALPSHWRVLFPHIWAECSLVCQEARRPECWFHGSHTRDAHGNFPSNLHKILALLGS